MAPGLPSALSDERRRRLEEARTQAEGHDVYRDFPPLSALAQRLYTPNSILVTGAAGFIASHVAIRLARLYPQYRVLGVDKISYCSNERNVVDPLADCQNFRFVRADVCDYELMVRLMEHDRVDTVMHLAAQSHVDLSFKEGGARQFTVDNVLGTASLLEAARKVGVKRFVHCSTDEVYGEGSFVDRVVFDEGAALKPNNPYSASKAGADLLAQSFHSSFGFPVVITRGNNVYGQHQFYEKVVPKFIAQLKLGKKITIHGSGRNTRNFLHVQDTASAFDAILHCGKDGEAYNIGGRNEKSILDLALDLLLLLGFKENQWELLVDYVEDRAHNDACYPISNAKLCALGWQEHLSWELGLASTARFVLARLPAEAEAEGLARVLEAHPQHSATDAALAGWTTVRARL